MIFGTASLATCEITSWFERAEGGEFRTLDILSACEGLSAFGGLFAGAGIARQHASSGYWLQRLPATATEVELPRLDAIVADAA